MGRDAIPYAAESPAMPLPADVADLPRNIFSGIAERYDRSAQLLSLLQYRRWHRFLLSRLPLPDDLRTAHSEPACPEPCRRVEGQTARILDMATGTGALAFQLARRPDLEVVAADITRPMLLQAQARAADGVRPAWVECTAEAPPFAAESFDAVVFAYLLRYVADVPETLRGLARLLMPGGTMASLDFAVPRGAAYPLWQLYTGLALPLGGALLSPAWRRVGDFLGPSIRDFYRHWPEDRLLEAWRHCGFPGVQSRRLSLGGALVVWGTRACPEPSRRAE